MLKLNYFLADIFILSAEKQPIKLSWRKIEWLQTYQYKHFKGTKLCLSSKNYNFVNKIIYRIIHSVIQATRLVKK